MLGLPAVRHVATAHRLEHDRALTLLQPTAGQTARDYQLNHEIVSNAIVQVGFDRDQGCTSSFSRVLNYW